MANILKQDLASLTWLQEMFWIVTMSYLVSLNDFYSYPLLYKIYGNKCSMYNFIVWIVGKNNGIFSYE